MHKQMDILHYTRVEIMLPKLPDVSRIYVIPLRLILYNSAAANNANVCMMITELIQLAALR